MAKNYRNTKYLDARPDVDQIFTDLEALHDFCRMEMLPFNEADLYNRHSRVWQRFEASKRPKKEYANNSENRSRTRFQNTRRPK
jgi:hypothetical protein